MSILGGEPFDQESELLVDLVEQVRSKYPEETIWCWTGYEFDQIKDRELTKYLDVAVCGPFKLDLRDISSNNLYRGSTNQHVINIQKSLAENRSIPLEGIPNNIIKEN